MPIEHQPTAYAYLRVSHPRSRDSGLSVGAQLDVCWRYYQLRLEGQAVKWWGLKEIPPDLNLGHYRDDLELIYDPAVSARIVPFLERHGGQRLSKLLAKGDHVIFAHLDRGVRAVLDHAALIDLWHGLGINIHYADLNVDLQTPHGMLVANIMAAVAQGQSDLISERNREIAARLRKMGRPTNRRVPRGFRKFKVNGQPRMAPDWTLRGYMNEIKRLREEMGLTYDAIACALNTHFCKLKNKEYKHSVFSPDYKWKRDIVSKYLTRWNEMILEDPSNLEDPTVKWMRNKVLPASE